jgi:shikimate dehydrogenase
VRARRPDAATGLVELGRARGVDVAVQSWPQAGDPWTADLVVSTVPASGTDGLVTGLPGVADTLLVDVVYAPWPTALAAAWEAAGGRVLGGLELLVAQAAHQVRLMTGKEPPVEAMRAAGLRALASR